ncbi:uncharacterized protein ARMOST_11260 [Armillaria ostoyae]|uniref:Uncharacterized protein n=1 Tax=Armillaria ostoyae TaxID=47428 RepID=A0A284RGL9_ARMOS|nr:uncharacterized protein ARMOST_11260 [Armillaria ostoyae]
MDKRAKSLAFAILTALRVESSLLSELKAFTEHPVDYTYEQLGRLFQRPADFPYKVAVSLDQHMKRLPWLFLIIFCTVFIGPDTLLTGFILIREIFFAVMHHFLYLFHGLLRSPSLIKYYEERTYDVSLPGKEFCIFVRYSNDVYNTWTTQSRILTVLRCVSVAGCAYMMVVLWFGLQ